MEENKIKQDEVLRADEAKLYEERRKLEENEKQTAFGREMALLVLLLAGSLWLLSGSIKIWQKKPGPNAPGMFPTVSTAIMTLCLLIAIVQLIVKRKQMPASEGKTVWQNIKLGFATEVPFTVFVTIISVLMYVVALSYVGFYISTFLWMAFIIWFLFECDKKKLVTAVAVAAGTDLAVYLIIQLLFNIRMP